MSNKEYLTCAETAVLIRKAFKRAFPGTKFSVRSDTYSGGASIGIKWTDGPTTKAVERVAKRYEGADFDGMIDLKTYKNAWLLPDGTVEYADSPGTEGSRGIFPAYDFAATHPGAQRVHFGADYIFCYRSFSPALLAKAKEYADAHPIEGGQRFEGEITVYVPDEDRLYPGEAQTHSSPPERAYAWLADHADIGAGSPTGERIGDGEHRDRLTKAEVGLRLDATTTFHTA